ncbi:MAG: Rho termination factor N-terminal domain-containing protein, partial [Eubacterium sp.]|nr:Rho termination factor N-terminal domain-containing protein [Eubacterium sp.]
MDLTKMTLAEMKELAKEKGITGITGMRKPDLAVKLIEVIEAEEKAK